MRKTWQECAMKTMKVEGEVAGAKHMQLVPPARCLQWLNLREGGRKEGKNSFCLPARSSSGAHSFPLTTAQLTDILSNSIMLKVRQVLEMLCKVGESFPEVWPQSTGLPLGWKTRGLNSIGLPWSETSLKCKKKGFVNSFSELSEPKIS